MLRHCFIILALLAFDLPTVEADAPREVQEFLNTHCLDCHTGESAEAGLDLTQLPTNLVAGEFETWVRVHDRVQSGEMPPPKHETLAPAALLSFTERTAAWLTEFQTKQQNELGRVHGRRLTNLQLERTLHDLLGVDIPLATLMPEEPRTDGFTTVAAGQSISHFQLQTHLTVVDAALAEAFRRATSEPDEWTRDLTARDVARQRASRRCREPEMLDGKAVVWAGGPIFYGRLPVTTAKQAGWYRITIQASALNKPNDYGVWCSVRTGMCVSGAPLMAWAGAFEAVEKPLEWTFEAWLPKGHMFEVHPEDATLRKGKFAGGQVGAGEGTAQRIPGVAIHKVQLQRIHRSESNQSLRTQLFGDLKFSVDKNSKRKKSRTIVSDNPLEDSARLVKTFATRAFRRPTTDDDAAPYIKLVSDALRRDTPLVEALRLGYRAILCSPRFLHLQEPVGQLDDYALACRLSYLLWNSMPDQRLLALASEGKFQKDSTIHREVERMLGDVRGQQFVKDLAHEWLDMSEIDFTEPDRRLYPGFDVIVQESMLEETHRFLQNMLEKNLSVTHLIDANYTFLNNRLARHYGIDRVPGDYFRQVRLRAEDHRGGLMTHGAIMKVTANGTTTSPVLRGVWISERLLGTEIPPPPGSVAAIEPDIRGATSIREMLEKHKSDASCASCHVKIDPPGFALENFDPAGRWRERYPAVVKKRAARGPVVEANFVMPDGRPFDDLAGFQQLVVEDRAKLAENVVSKLITYGTGASCTFADRAEVQRIVEQSVDSDFGLRTILKNVVASDIFRSK